MSMRGRRFHVIERPPHRVILRPQPKNPGAPWAALGYRKDTDWPRSNPVFTLSQVGTLRQRREVLRLRSGRHEKGSE
jgi:hypothetical protein